MVKRGSIGVGCVALAVIVVGAAISSAATWRRAEYLTFNGAISLPGVTLPAGTYVFELADLHGNPARYA